MRPMRHRDLARRAKGGDRAALDLVILQAPRGLRGKAPDEYASAVSEDDAFAKETKGEVEEDEGMEGEGMEEEGMKEGEEGEEGEGETEGPEACIAAALTAGGVDADDVPDLARDVAERLRADGYLSEEGEEEEA